MSEVLSQKKWFKWVEAFRVAVTGQGILFLAFTAGCVGIFYAKALLSIYSGIVFGVAALNLIFNRHAWDGIIKYRALLALMGITCVYLLSGIQSDDLHRWAKLTWENIPYATLPLGFYMYRDVPGKTWKRLLLIFTGIAFCSACGVMIDYAMHFEAYNALYKVGQTIPMPIIHVRYSFFMALASCLAFALAYEWPAHDRQKRFLLLGLGVFLTIVVHVLAVRTGILALYGGIGVLLVSMIIRDRQWKVGIAAVIAIFLVGLIAWKTFPSVANKVGYVLYDLRMLKEQGALAEYSDNVRITSIRHGLALVRENMITGVGIGDMKAEMGRMYARYSPGFPEESRFPPISQYVFILTAFGIVGGLLFFGLLLYPLFRTPFSYVLAAIYATTLFSAIGETTIELLLGKTVFVSLVCIAIMHVRSAKRSGDPGGAWRMKDSNANRSETNDRM